MQTRVSLPLGARTADAEYCPRLSVPQKAIADWACVDDHQAILDACCADAGLLVHYVRNYRVRACAMVSDTVQETGAKNLLGMHAEVLRSDMRDIPWRDGSFDSVFITPPFQGRVENPLILRELQRVLKPGGQLLVSVPCVPILTRLGIRWPDAQDVSKTGGPYRLMDCLQGHGFAEVSMRVSRLNYATVIARRPSGHQTGSSSRTEWT